MQQKQGFFDHTREMIAFIWTFAIIGILVYAIVHFGMQKEILLWILAYIAGVSSVINGAYYSINTHKPPQLNTNDTITTTTVSSPNIEDKKLKADNIEVTGDNVNVQEK